MCTFDLLNEFEGFNPDTYGTPESSLLKKVREAGYRPIAITVILCEETFIFKNQWDAFAAAAKFLPEGWWYDLNAWNQTREEYVKKFYEGDDDLAPTVYWLDKNFAPKSKK